MQSKEYYTAQEAQEILNMTYSALRNQVIAGNIRKVTPPGKRQAVYLKEDVDALKHDMQIWRAARQQTKLAPTKFVKATVEDMPAAVAMANEVFGGLNTIPVEKRVAWLEKNPDIDYFLKQDGKIVGYFSLVPLRPETIDDLLRLRRYAKDLTADDILAYVPGVPVDLYGMAIGIIPGVSQAQKHEWGKILMIGARGVILDLARKGIIIRTINAHSFTADGIKMMRHLGFTETIPKAPGLHDFIIEVEREGVPFSGISFVMKYREILEQWQESRAGDNRERAYSKTDSKTREFSLTTTDASEQNGAKRASPSRSHKAL